MTCISLFFREANLDSPFGYSILGGVPNLLCLKMRGDDENLGLRNYRPAKICSSRVLSDEYLLSHKYFNANLREQISLLSLMAANSDLKRGSELDDTFFDSSVKFFNSCGSPKAVTSTFCSFVQSKMNLSIAGAIVTRPMYQAVMPVIELLVEPWLWDETLSTEKTMGK